MKKVYFTDAENEDFKLEIIRNINNHVTIIISDGDNNCCTPFQIDSQDFYDIIDELKKCKEEIQSEE
jgi:hypothetical protein